MRRNILNSTFVMACLLLLVACAPKKIIVVPPVAVVTKDTTAVQPEKKVDNVGMLQSKNFGFNTLALKGKAKLDIDGDENNVGIIIRIQHNEMIWVSVTAIIGEVARVSITPDSIRIINRLQTTYTKKPLSFINDFTSKKIDFAVLENILTGNTVNKFIGPAANATQSNGVWTISGTNEELAYRFLFSTLLRVQETTINDESAGQALKVNYANYQQLNGSLFPTSLIINSLAGTKKINIQLDFSAIEGNVPVDMPFSVKSRFKVIN